MAAFALTAATGAMAQPKESKIGYIDLQRVLANSQAGKEAKSQLDKESEAKKKVLEEKKKDLQKIKAELENQSLAISDEAKKRKEESLLEKKDEIMQFLQKAERELQLRDSELTKKILSELEDVIKKMGKEGDYTIIIEKTEGGLLYASDEIDLTDRIIKEYDKRKK